MYILEDGSCLTVNYILIVALKLHNMMNPLETLISRYLGTYGKQLRIHFGCKHEALINIAERADCASFIFRERDFLNLKTEREGDCMRCIVAW